MSRQFLIPWWFLLAKLIYCQQPQNPNFEHTDHFQHLFIHPTIPPQQNPFAIDGFRALHNQPQQPPMMHPHYEFLAQNGGGGHMMNQNFIHPHPFFQLHPHHFASSLPPPTSMPTTPRLITTIRPSTIVTTQPSTTTETTTTLEVTRAPQASKPIVESVKTYTPENAAEQKQQIVELSSLEKMIAPNPNNEKKAQKFPTPSSTVLPTAQQIENQTTTVESTSTISTTIQPTTTPAIITQATTNLPKKISDEASRAALNGEKLDLVKHLNASDLESFLKSANLSTNEAQNFLKLVERVLEDELQKRLHKRKDEQPLDQKTISNSTISGSINSIKPVESNVKYVNNEGHEVKTVNTRLNYESSEIDQSTNNSTSTPTSTASTPSRVAAYSQHSALEINSADKSRSNPTFSSLDEVRQREQEEFDRLLGQIVLGKSNEEEIRDDEVDETEDDDLLASSSIGSTMAPQSPPRNNYNRPSIRHPPKTTFDQLVQDYQYRLSGSNGFNDLIKALRNAHIGFFDRTKKQKSKIKIN